MHVGRGFHCSWFALGVCINTSVYLRVKLLAGIDLVILSTVNKSGRSIQLWQEVCPKCCCSVALEWELYEGAGLCFVSSMLRTVVHASTSPPKWLGISGHAVALSHLSIEIHVWFFCLRARYLNFAAVTHWRQFGYCNPLWEGSSLKLLLIGNVFQLLWW